MKDLFRTIMLITLSLVIDIVNYGFHNRLVLYFYSTYRGDYSEAWSPLNALTNFVIVLLIF